MKLLKSFPLFLLAAYTAFAQPASWKFDAAHSQVQFTVTHLVISEVTGSFRKFDGQVTTEGSDFSTAKINFTVETSSVFTDNDKRDNHLKSDDFFNAEKYPQIKFVGKSIKKVGDNKYKLKGDFTIRNITKEIELDVTQTGTVNAWGSERTGFKIKGNINRFDYGLKWDNLTELGGAVVGKDVELTCNIELVKDSKS